MKRYVVECAVSGTYALLQADSVQDAAMQAAPLVGRNRDSDFRLKVTALDGEAEFVDVQRRFEIAPAE